MNNKIKKILTVGIIITIGLIILKFTPMLLFGKNILFDASMHISTAIFILYILWFFIDQNKTWRLPYMILSIAILTIIAFQRILTNNHNDIGILLGLCLGIIAIFTAEKSLRKKLDF